MKGKFINKPLFGLQRKSNKNLFIVFSVVVSFMLVFAVALFPTLQKVTNEMPDTLKDLVAMTSIGEYFNAEALEMWILLVSIFVAVMAINITTNEFKNGSYELIYTLNISREEIIRTKLLRLVLNTIYINVICFVVSLISLFIFGTGGFSVVNLIIYTLLAMVVTLQVAILIFSLGLLNKKHFNTFSGVFIVIVMYLFTMLSNASSDGKFDWVGYLSPLSTMKDTVMLDGFKGIFTNGILFAVWSFISIIMLVISSKRFKNDDLC